MSFDLAVWFEPEPISDRQAAEKYQRLCDLDADSTIPTDPRVAAFYRDLTELFPDLGATADASDIERSPWTVGLDTTPTSVVMAISWSRATEVVGIVRELAHRHGLICYDPQSGETSQPAKGVRPGLSLSSCDGSRSINPGPKRIEQAMRRLSVDNWFAILERDDDRWIQAGYGDQAGTRPGWYAIERRDGSAEHHYGTAVSDINEVVKAFQQYARGDESWRRRFAWKKVHI